MAIHEEPIKTAHEEKDWLRPLENIAEFKHFYNQKGLPW